MMPAILWKEYREHRLVWAALAFLGAITVLSLSYLMRVGWLGRPSDARITLCAFAVMVVGAYALICGAMMLAGERENGTMPYLDALPGFRRRLWQGKLLAGVLLVFGQIIFLLCLAAAASLFESWRVAWWTAAAMLMAGLYGLSWGMLFSSLCRSVINAVLLSLAGQLAVFWLTGQLAGFVVGGTSLFSGMAAFHPAGPLWAALFGIAAPAALVGSALVFTWLDRNRLRAVPESLPVQGPILHPSWSMLFWLTWRQARGFTIGIAVFSLFLGFVIFLEPFLLWPAATMIVGVLCGATAFADEQQGALRFLGDQRLPLGRLWVVKVGVRFGIAVVAALLVLAPSFINALCNMPTWREINGGTPYHFFGQMFHNDIFVNSCPAGLFLTLWLAYGFAAGCLFGLLYRHGLAAGVFALFTCLLTAGLWMPSLIGGGLHAWQVFGPPVLLLIAVRLLMRPWAAGRIASWTTALRLIPFVVAAGLWIAGGLWYRVLEIPNVHSDPEINAFRATLPTPEQDESGRLFHTACLRFDDLRRALESQQMPPQPLIQNERRKQRDADVLEHGWPSDDKDLAVWLDKMYVGEWPTLLKQAADLPTSPFDDVRKWTVLEPVPATVNSSDVAVALALRGLQRQAAADDEAYVENLRIGLALSRSLRDRTPAIDLIFGRKVEGTLLKGLDRWLEKLHGKPDLIRQALALLSRHLDETVDDGKDVEEIAALIGQNTLDIPLSLDQYLSFYDGPTRQDSGSIQDERVQIDMARLVPWEQARQVRIFRLKYLGDRRQQGWFVGRQNELGPLVQFGPNDSLIHPDRLRNLAKQPEELCVARAMQLKLALRWYQADNGKPAKNLDELVPKYLSSIPSDPYDGKPFYYRLSQGEDIRWPAGSNSQSLSAEIQPGVGEPAITKRRILSGQGILWAGNFVFLVPLPPKTK